MVKSLRVKFDESVPIVAHCSAGVGRSGVLVLSDMLTEAYDSGEVREDTYYVLVEQCIKNSVIACAVVFQELLGQEGV